MIAGKVRFGTGPKVGANVRMEWQDTAKRAASYIGLKSGQGSSAEWRFVSPCATTGRCHDVIRASSVATEEEECAPNNEPQEVRCCSDRYTNGYTRK